MLPHVHHHLSQPSTMLQKLGSSGLFRSPFPDRRVSTVVERVHCSSDAVERLKASIEPLLRNQTSQLEYIRQHGDVPIMEVTPKHLLNGMRGVPSLVWDVSSVDSKKGIRYRGIRPEDLIERLPRGPRASIPSMEAVFWLLMTGSMPTADEERVLRTALVNAVPFDEICDTCFKVIDALPQNLHPMTQFTIGILSSQKTSSFSDAYAVGIATKSNLWEFALLDVIKLLAHLPIVAAYVYRRLYHPETLSTFRDEVTATSHADVDWTARFAMLIGTKDLKVHDLLRLYILLHADHEGGNVSAHTANLVSSAHADPFLAFAAAMCGLAGPLHGLANQDCLRWLLKLQDQLTNEDLADETRMRATIRRYAENEFNSGRLIPGYGHAVLRDVDPRFSALKRWGEQNAPNDPLIRLNIMCSEEVPKILAKSSKVSNPHPNVDCGSGTALYFSGIKEPEFFTVLFGLSRSVGILASIVWARIFRSPLERPKSLTIDGLKRAINKKLAKKGDSASSSP
eukprot:Blabericola_migrator_1__312@NODE_107_length_14077_cov_92_419629_g95_i0_p3_GENE_NODE_107_length_14077_cov_92_419629_g95_i0NODE_107_length_14077_cov_92_419629_g95_i0_p3_ORF_typecomplete_len511_score47_97Citrate_synt/PF00285_21/1_1e65Phage_TAC_11/PF11836_8/0_069SpoVIF/PF14069_6/0_11_NODE_107_length_14077_cov_92_419629_g95_i010842616